MMHFINFIYNDRRKNLQQHFNKRAKIAVQSRVNYKLITIMLQVFISSLSYIISF